jgi:hypothetical protein
VCPIGARRADRAAHRNGAFPECPRQTTYGADAYTPAVDERATLTQARSMSILLLATCQQTQLALAAAANELDTDLATLLDAMIERTENELVALTEKIKALSD